MTAGEWNSSIYTVLFQEANMLKRLQRDIIQVSLKLQLGTVKKNKTEELNAFRQNIKTPNIQGNTSNRVSVLKSLKSELTMWNEQNARLVHGSARPFILHGCWWWRSGQRIAMPHSSPYSPPSVFLHYRPQRWIFPPRAPYLTDMHLLSPQREGGCLLCFLLNPTRLLASITQRTPEKCSLKKKERIFPREIKVFRSSVIRTHNPGEVLHTRDGYWLDFTIGGISYSVESGIHR